MKADVEIPFEEVLEKAKAGDPKAQTEVRTSIGVRGRKPVLETSKHRQRFGHLGWGES